MAGAIKKTQRGTAKSSTKATEVSTDVAVEEELPVTEDGEVTAEATVDNTVTEDTGVTIEGLDEQEELKPVPTPPKSVKIKMARDHKCSIGGVRYHLEKGKTYVVPENVKRILGSVGLLLPL